MPVVVKFEKTASPLEHFESDRVTKALKALCVASATYVKAEVAAALLAQGNTLTLSDVAVAQYPELRDIGKLFMAYLSALQVVETADGAALEIDQARLQLLSISEDLPMELEFGSPIGIPPIAHWRPVIERFHRFGYKQLARGFFAGV